MTHELTGPVGIIADTHDNEVLIQKQLTEFKQAGVREVLHAGDVHLPETIALFEDFQFHHVWGNADINKYLEHESEMNAAIDAIDGYQDGWSERYAVGPRRIMLRHGLERSPSYALAATDDSLDVVVHGHLHYQEKNVVGDGAGRVFNPGNKGAILYFPEDDTFEFLTFDAEQAPEDDESAAEESA